MIIRKTFVHFSRLTILVALVLNSNIMVMAQGWTTPIEGEQGKDWLIVNYVDWELLGFQDYSCGTKSYDGHQGTDYVLKSFAQMDSGVYILAADTGIVFKVLDSLFDRNKAINAGGLGNYIGIEHPGQYQAYYAHLKKASSLVNPGDTVYPGQRIAQVGSSGNSTDPHLHFEVWYDSSFVVDPFSGPCGNATTLWENPLPYDSSFGLSHSGMLGFVPVSRDTLIEHPEGKIEFSDNTDTSITYWSLMHGLRKGDSLKIEWYTPNNLLWFDFTFYINQDWWYYSFWSYIDFPVSNPGTWTVTMSRNGVFFDSIDFDVELNATRNEEIEKQSTIELKYYGGNIHIENVEGEYQYQLMDIQGRIIKTGISTQTLLSLSSELQDGIYIFKAVDQNQINALRFYYSN